MKAKLLIIGLVFMATTAVVSAQCKGNGMGNGKCKGTVKDSAYVDKNKDGICDKYETRTANVSCKKGNGKCDGTGQCKGKGKIFVDANKNGVCDHKEAQVKK